MRFINMVNAVLLVILSALVTLVLARPDMVVNKQFVPYQIGMAIIVMIILILSMGVEQ